MSAILRVMEKRSLGWIGKIILPKLKTRETWGFFHSPLPLHLNSRTHPRVGGCGRATAAWLQPQPRREGHKVEQSGRNSLDTIKVLFLSFFPEQNIFLPRSQREGPAGLELS